jgi:hypothetical protein
MSIYFSIMRIIHLLVYGLSARIIKPQTEQEAEALAELTHSLLFDPLSINKDKQS